MTRLSIPRIRDFLFAEVGLRGNLFDEEVIAKGLGVLDEMSRFGIETPLATVLVDRKLIDRGTVRTIVEILSGVEVATTCCRERVSMDKLSKEGRIRCPDCNKLVAIELREGVSNRPGTSDQKLCQIIHAVSLDVGGPGSSDATPHDLKRARPLELDTESRTPRPKKRNRTRPSESRPEVESDARITDLTALVGKIHSVSPSGVESRKRIEKYRCKRLLGHGPRGHTYLARLAAEKGSPPLALKLYELRRGADPNWAATAREQLDAWSDCSSSATTSLRHEVCVEKGVIYVLRPFLGDDYQDMTELGSLRSDEKVKLLREVVVRLSEAHGAGLVHGNLKPSNIFFRRREFAFEVALVDPLLAPSAKPRDLERWNMVARAPQYRSPEEIEGNCPTQASDVYALGWVIYTALAGKPPFESLAADEVLRRHRHGPIPVLPDRCGSWCQLVIASTAVDPAERIGDARELLAQVESVLKGNRPRLPRVTPRAPTTASEIETEEAPSPGAEGSRSHPFRALVACLLLLGVGFWSGLCVLRWREARAMLTDRNRTLELYHHLAEDAFREARSEAERNPEEGWNVWKAFLSVYGNTPFEGAATAEQRQFRKPRQR